MTAAQRTRKRRVRDVAIIMGVAGVAALVLAGLLKAAANRTAVDDIRVTVRGINAQFMDRVSRVEGSLVAAREYGVDPSDMDAARHYFTSTVIPEFKKLAGISLTERGGDSFYLLRDGTLRDIRAEGQYDPEKRSWFEGALELRQDDACHWTEIYDFHTLQEPGITASLGWISNRGTDVVVAYDVLLDDLFTAVKTLSHRESSLTFLFDENETLYVSGDAMQLARKGYEAWRNHSKNSDSGIWIRRIPIGRDAWWCGVTVLEESTPRKWICVMIPQGGVVGGTQAVLYLGITAILIAAMIAVYLIFSRKRSDLLFADDVDPEQIKALIEKGENSAVEFKSTMRMNLHSKKPGKEIELAWLKGVAAFLNTKGGTLLLGVTDTGEITGLEQDLFESEDKCRLHFKNLIAKGLGADVSTFIRLTLLSMGAKTVGVVECLKSSRPVYLRDGNKEAFYIRNGPSSDELPASRLVDYIAEHWI